MTEKFTVIVTAYNTSKYIEQCINSILNQTYDNYEIIIVDDGSTDDTLRKILKYNDNNKVKIIKQEHGGTSAGRNNGLRHASGTWITFVDSDDWIDKDYLMEMYNIIKQNKDIEVIISNLIVNKDEQEYKLYELPNSFIVDDKKSLIETTIAIDYGEKKYGLKYGNCRCIGAKVYKADLIKRQNILFPEDLFLWEDGIFNLYSYNSAKEIMVLNKEWYHYRYVESSSTHRNDFIQKEENDKILKHIIEFCNENDYNYESINYSVLELLLVSIHKIKKDKKLYVELYKECKERNKYLKNIKLTTEYINKKERKYLILLKTHNIKLIYYIRILRNKIKEIIR